MARIFMGERPPYIADGTYPAKIIDLQYHAAVETSYGPRTAADVKFKLQGGKVITQRYFTPEWNEGKFAKLLDALFGEVPESVSNEDLEWVMCYAIVENVQLSSGKLWAQVVEVDPYEDPDGDVGENPPESPIFPIESVEDRVLLPRKMLKNKK